MVLRHRPAAGFFFRYPLGRPKQFLRGDFNVIWGVSARSSAWIGNAFEQNKLVVLCCWIAYAPSKNQKIFVFQKTKQKKHFCISGVMLAHAMADVGCRIIAFARDIHAVAKLLQTVFLHKWKDFCPNFLKWPVPPRLLQKVWDFFVMMIETRQRRKRREKTLYSRCPLDSSRCWPRCTLQQVSAGFFQVLASPYL